MVVLIVDGSRVVMAVVVKVVVVDMEATSPMISARREETKGSSSGGEAKYAFAMKDGM